MAQIDGSGWSKNFISSDWQWISVLENSLTLTCHVTTSSWSQFALENAAVTSISQHFAVEQTNGSVLVKLTEVENVKVFLALKIK